ncbi:hypothetical protein Pyrde_1520 [Pyrodictium delaneyi]|uniref:Phosphatidic acid phosphatase type 2/haloperoxidase domain-containing protein n=2 Tax=Pyrodictium delaneyi TaxID=1273541 RepID=A0A0P0N3Q6_9CREN|nr:hypothetical protein Pyrde_1520 [Pyrodictium delaneyi]
MENREGHKLMDKHRLLEFALLVGASLELITCISGSIDYCRAVTYLGDEAIYMLVGILIYALLSGVLGVRLVSGLALVSSIVVALKVFVGLPRPPMETWLVEASGPAFPSGHAALSAAFWAMVALYTRSVLLAVVGVVHTAAVSLSRLVLHVHYPRDVVGGIVIGTVMSIAAYKLLVKRDIAWVPLLLGVVGLPLAVAALVASPTYRAAARLTGIDAGLIAAGLILARIKRVEEILEAPSLMIKIASLVLSLASLAVAMMLEKIGLMTGVVGFSFFALATALSKPLLTKLASSKLE